MYINLSVFFNVKSEMENYIVLQGKNNMKKEYYAHYRKENDTFQKLEVHLLHTACLSMQYCPVPLLKKAAWLSGFYHDMGKYREEWQEYFQKAIRVEKKNGGEKIDHATLGGLAAENTMQDSLLREMIETAIYNHHGITDCITVNDGTSLVLRRRKKYEKTQIDAAKSQIEEFAQELPLEETWKEASEDIQKLTKKIFSLAGLGEKKNQYGNKQFYLGMCERMLFSCLMDGDFRDTADFMNDQRTFTGPSEQELGKIWQEGIVKLEQEIESFQRASRIDQCRMNISKQCTAAAMSQEKIYRLAVPTGAGKTLSSLRFALHCAKNERKRHIFYIAPFRSILEQNADVIRTVLGADIVLEHHSDVVCETEDQMEQYQRLTENWDEVPVIVTTAVQFFNTLFKEKGRNIRRFHSLGNSVIIMDEVQAFPVKLIQLFNMAANFLTQICGSTVVLCTATQPLLDKIRENRLLPPKQMVADLKEYEPVFRRIEFEDDTERFAGGASEEQISEFILERETNYGQVLVIVNTKACAEKVYHSLSEKTEGHLFHLSTNMCAEHRRIVLEQIQNLLIRGEKVICVSTQLIEAGVDCSFRCVIRSLAGLDNLIQSAGRCNRNGEAEMGYVYLVRLSPELEDVSRITDIRKAQDAMRRLLIRIHQKPDELDFRLDSEKAIDCYYKFYFYDRQNEMNYPVKVEGVSTNLVDLLSGNQSFAKGIRGIYLKQAFRSAGEAFEVIEEHAGADVIVPFGQAPNLLNALRGAEEIKDKKRILRLLQRYSVSLSDTQLRKLGNAVYKVEEDSILVLADGYYSDDTGVTEYAEKMPMLFC